MPLNERVRSYPIDRAYRLVHGVIDLLRTCRARNGDLPWVLRPARALKWRALALSIYNHYGFYEDALRAAGPVVDDVDAVVAACDGIFRRWDVVSGIFNALVARGRPEDAHRLVLEQAEHPATPRNDLMGIYYSLAMLNARFMRNPDFALAERWPPRNWAGSTSRGRRSSAASL